MDVATDCRCEDEESLMDPSMTSSTVTLMAQPAGCDDSFHGINNIPSPVGGPITLRTHHLNEIVTFVQLIFLLFSKLLCSERCKPTK